MEEIVCKECLIVIFDKLDIRLMIYCKCGKYSGVFNIAEIAGRQNALYLKPTIFFCPCP